MPHCLLKIEALPADSVDAAAVFYREYLDQIDHMMAKGTQALAICMPSAPRSHDHWRRAAARDLARKYAPNRINIVGGSGGVEFEAILTYLEGASAITGQYLAAHE